LRRRLLAAALRTAAPSPSPPAAARSDGSHEEVGMNPKQPPPVPCSFHSEVNFPLMVIGSPMVSICAEEEHREHQQQAAAGDEERQVHPGVQDRPQDAAQLQGYRSHFFSKRCLSLSFR